MKARAEVIVCLSSISINHPNEKIREIEQRCSKSTRSTNSRDFQKVKIVEALAAILYKDEKNFCLTSHKNKFSLLEEHLCPKSENATRPDAKRESAVYAYCR